MKASVTFVFSLLFVAVAAVYFYMVPPPAPPPDAAAPKAPSGALLPFDKKQPLVWIQIQNIEKNLTMTLEKKDEDWTIKFPVEGEADNRMIEGLVQALQVSTRARRFPRDKDWEEYGLWRPKLKVGIKAQGQDRRYLLFGDASPVGPQVFARWEGETEYFLVSEDLKRAFERSVYSLRRKEIISLPAQDIIKLHLQSPSGDYEIMKKDDKWFWTEPIPVLGSLLTKAQTDEILNSVARLYVKDFLDGETQEPSESGLAAPETLLTVATAKQTLELKIGGEITAKDGFYAQTSGKDSKVILIAQANLRKLFETIETMAKDAEGKAAAV